MGRFRFWLLRVHGGLLMVAGCLLAAVSTWGMLTGAGLMGFLAQHRLGHVGLIQAYLLVAVIGIVLWSGARRTDPRFYHRIGALAHLAILSAYAFHWDYFPQIAPQGAMLRNAVWLHLALCAVESWCGLSRAGIPPGGSSAARC
ncbi:MAG: hypothetical protein IT495_16920 [Gammaproteobacteria bacterium]|nr:hypothetical protein [Gammaproteobacteria bacterium]